MENYLHFGNRNSLKPVNYSIRSTLELDGLGGREFLVLRSIYAVALVLVIDEAVTHKAGGRNLYRLTSQRGWNYKGGCGAWRNSYANIKSLIRKVPFHFYITIRSRLQGTDEADAVSHLRTNEEMAVSRIAFIWHNAGQRLIEP